MLIAVMLVAAILSGAMAGCSTLVPIRELPRTVWIDAGDDGSFLRPLSAVEQRAASKRRRAERRRAKRQRGKQQRSARTRPAGPANSSHRPPQAKNDSRKAAATPFTMPSAALVGGGHRWDKALRRVRVARRFIGRRDLGSKPFVDVVLRASGQSLKLTRRPYAAFLHRRLKRARKLVRTADARPGDILLFAKTHDLNGNGRPDDGVTWAGIVEEASGGRLVFIAHRAGKVRRMAASPRRPKAIRDGGVVINTRLVRWPGAGRSLTAGECLVAIGRL